MRFAHFTALFLFVSSTLFWSIHAGQFLKDFLESSAKWRHHSISDCDIRVAMDLSQSKAENNIVEPRDFHSLGLSTLGAVSFWSLDSFKAVPLDFWRCSLHFLVGEDFQKMSNATAQIWNLNTTCSDYLILVTGMDDSDALKLDKLVSFKNVLLLQRSKSGQFLLRTLCPFCIKDTPSFVTVSIWSEKRKFHDYKNNSRSMPNFIGEKEVFFPDHYKNFQGSTMRLLYKYYPALSGLNTKIHENGSRSFFGHEWESTRFLRDKLNFTLRMVESFDSWSTILRVVGKGDEAEWCTLYVLVHWRLEFVDYMNPSFAHETSAITFYTTLPGELPKHLAILWPFDFKLWLSVIVAFFMVALIQKLVSKSEDGIKETMGLLGLLANKGVQNWPSSSSHSYVLTSWAVFSAILILIYSSLLINFLTVPAKLEVPTTWDELLKEPDYNILMPGDSYLKTMFETSTEQKSPTFKKVWDKFRSQPDYESKLLPYGGPNFRRAMKNAKGNKTVIIGQIWSEVVNTLYTRPTGDLKITVAKERSAPRFYSDIMKKNCPYRDNFRDISQIYVEMGAHRHMFNKHIGDDRHNMLEERQKVDKELLINDELDINPLVMKHFVGPFGLLGLGFTFASIIFAIEITLQCT